MSSPPHPNPKAFCGFSCLLWPSRLYDAISNYFLAWYATPSPQNNPSAQPHWDSPGLGPIDILPLARTPFHGLFLSFETQLKPPSRSTPTHRSLGYQTPKGASVHTETQSKKGTPPEPETSGHSRRSQGRGSETGHSGSGVTGVCPGLDPGAEKGYQWKNWWTSNQIWIESNSNQIWVWFNVSVVTFIS